MSSCEPRGLASSSARLHTVDARGSKKSTSIFAGCALEEFWAHAGVREVGTPRERAHVENSSGGGGNRTHGRPRARCRQLGARADPTGLTVAPDYLFMLSLKQLEARACVRRQKRIIKYRPRHRCPK
jgi:hypothetical protein